MDDDIYERGEIFYVLLNSSDPFVDVGSPIAEVKITDKDGEWVWSHRICSLTWPHPLPQRKWVWKGSGCGHVRLGFVLEYVL